MFPFVIAQLVGTLDVGERTDVRVRDSGVGPETDAEAAFRFRMTLRGRRVELSLGANPRLTAFSWVNDDRRSVLASAPGQLGIGYRERHFGIFLSQDGSYGLENYATLRYPSTDPLPGTPPGQPTPPQPLPTLPGASTLGLVSSRSALSAYETPSSRWLVTEAAAFELSGGANETSRAFVPLQYGPRFAIAVDHRATHLDHVGASVDASFAHFSSGADAGIATALVRYGRDLARGTTLTLGAGAAAAAFRTEPQPYRTRPYATAEITLAHHRPLFGHRLDLDGAARFGPTIDRIAGTVDPRVSAAVGATYTTRSYVLRVGASFTQSVLADSAASITAFGAEGTVRVPFTRTVALEGGSRIAIQSFQGAAFETYAFFLALDLHPDVLHFRTP
ncbi:hypothetical protein BH09MYX1_BH09MYX1_31420 [soil metagenome]